MKKLLLLILMSIPCVLLAQGNLQFNRVLLVSDLTQTVPQGKVWKIENIAIDAAGTLNIYETQGYLANDPGGTICQSRNISNGYWEIDGEKRMCSGAGTSGSSLPSSSCFPFWLPEGTVLRTLCPAATLSVIEFNVCMVEGCN